MRLITGIQKLKGARRPVVIAAGFFDGIHRGHIAVIRTAIRKARRIGGSAWVMTFDPHPMDVLSPGKAPPLLTCNMHKMKLLDRLGVDGCILVPFTRKLAAEEPEDFVESLCSSLPSLREIVVGHDWRFGRNGRGTPEMLAAMAGKCGIRVTVVSAVVSGRRPVSSTRIRMAVADGNLGEAERMMGRPFSVLGRVMRGRAIGRKLGFPTANLDVRNEVLPPKGVYAVRAVVDEEQHDGIVNLGVKPTFCRKTQKSLLELHIFDLCRDLYGREIEVRFVAKLRNERKFANNGALSAQIAKDVAAARKVLFRS